MAISLNAEKQGEQYREAKLRGEEFEENHYHWFRQHPYNVFLGYISFTPGSSQLGTVEHFLSLSRKRYWPSKRPLKAAWLAKEWCDSHGLTYQGLDYFIEHIKEIDTQEKADEINTVLYFIAKKHYIPWVNKKDISPTDICCIQFQKTAVCLLVNIYTREDLLKVDNALKAESIRRGRFVLHAQDDEAAAKADQ